jgi:hypothetical protein
MARIRSWAGPLLLAVCAICVCLQVFVRPAVGIANNGDFPKMAGAFVLGPAEGDWDSHVQYGEFVYRYIRSNRYSYNYRFRTAEFLSSEFFLIDLASQLQRHLRPGPRFDIRWLGAVGSVLWLLALGVLIYALPIRWRLYAGAPLVLIWTDVAYVQYMNSFYMDTAALIFLVLAVAAGLHLAKGGNHRLLPLIMTSAATLFAASKTQHVLPGLLFLPLFAVFAFGSRDRLERISWIAGSALLVLASYVVMRHDSPQWRATAVYNVVFGVLIPGSPDRLRTVEDVGLGQTDLRYVGMNAFSPDSPLQNPEWTREFARRCNYVTLFRYFVSHPSITGATLYRELSGDASNIRPWGNLALEDGFKPRDQASTFTYWSDFRSFLLKHAPWHIILLALVTVGTAVWLLVLSPADRRLAGLALVIQAIAALEYAVAILADGVETDRHLLLFHAATDITILLLPWLISALHTRLQARRFAQTESVVVHG